MGFTPGLTRGWGVWRQEQEPGTDVLLDGGGLRAAVGGEVVQDEEDQKTSYAGIWVMA